MTVKTLLEFISQLVPGEIDEKTIRYLLFLNKDQARRLMEGEIREPRPKEWRKHLHRLRQACKSEYEKRQQSVLKGKPENKLSQEEKQRLRAVENKFIKEKEEEYEIFGIRKLKVCCLHPRKAPQPSFRGQLALVVERAIQNAEPVQQEGTPPISVREMVLDFLRSNNCREDDISKIQDMDENYNEDFAEMARILVGLIEPGKREKKADASAAQRPKEALPPAHRQLLLEIKSALLEERAKLWQLRDQQEAARREYDENRTPSAEKEFAVSNQALREQKEFMEQWRRSIIDLLEIASSAYEKDELDIREEAAREAASQGGCRQANRILRDSEWQEDMRTLDEALEDERASCRRYISGQKLLIANLKDKTPQSSKKEIIEIFERITRLSESYQIELSTLLTYSEFLYSQKKYTQALEAAQRLHQHYKLRKDTPNSDKVKLYIQLGEIYYMIHDLENAIGFCRRAERHLKEEPYRYGRERIQLYNTMSDAYWRAHHSKEAKRCAAEVLRLFEKYGGPEDDAGLLQKAHTNKRLATLANREWNLDGAVEHHLAALRIEKKLCAEHPENEEYSQALAVTCNNLGIVYRRMGKYLEAEEVYRQSFDIRKEKCATSGKSGFDLGLAITGSNYGYLLACAGRQEDAEMMMEDTALPIKERLWKEDPKINIRSYALSLTDYGFVLSCSGEPDKWKRAEELFSQAIEIGTSLMEKDYETHSIIVAEAYFEYGSLLKKMGKPREADAAACFQKALDIYLELEKRDPGYYQHGVGTASLELAEALLKQRAREEAVSLYRQALYFGKNIMEKAAPYYQADYLRTLEGLVELLSNCPQNHQELDGLRAELSEFQNRKGVDEAP